MPPAAKGAEPLSYVARRQDEILPLRTASHIRGVGNPMLRISILQQYDIIK